MSKKSLEELIKELKQISISKRYLLKLDHRKQLYETALVSLKSQIDLEYEDILKLENRGINSIFYRILGSYDEKMELEKQEYLQAIMNYRKSKRSLKLVNFEIGVLKEKIEKEDELRKKLQKIIKKEQHIELLQNKSQQSAHIKMLLKELDENLTIKIEIEEALKLSKHLIELLTNIESLLKKVETWGEKTNNKLGKIDEAQELCYKADQLLAKFEEELQEVLGYLKINIEDSISRMVGFDTLYIEHLISDWIIRKKLVNGIYFVASLHDRIRRINNSLSYELNKVDKKIYRLKREKDNILMGLL